MSSTTTASSDTASMISCTPLAHQRMHDAVELGALLVVDERHGGQRGPVQRAVGQQDVLAERLDQRGQPLGAGFDDLAGDDVAVDDDAAALVERGGHRRLAGADTAGQTDAQHGQLPPRRRTLRRTGDPC